MFRSGILTSAILLGIVISAAVTIQRYLSLPPGSGEDMALTGLPYNCVLYGVLPGLVVGAVAAWGVGKLGIRVSHAAKRRLCVGAGAIAVSLLLLLFYGRADVNKLAVTVVPVVTTAQAQGFKPCGTRRNRTYLSCPSPRMATGALNTRISVRTIT